MERREVTFAELAIRFEADRSGSGFQVRASSLEGECTEPLEISPSPRYWQSHCTKLICEVAAGSPVVRAKSELPLHSRDLGALLFQALFRGSLRHLYERSRARFLRPPSAGLRLRLFFDFKDPRLAELYQLPWEMLYSKDSNDFLALSRLTPLVRSLEMPRPSRCEPIRAPLKILLAAANSDGNSHLNLEREQRKIEQAVEGRGAEIVVLPNADIESLHAALGRQEFHVFHFMGHGTFNSPLGYAYIGLRDAGSQAPSALLAEDLANLLRDRSLHLVVLNACQTARSHGLSVGAVASGVAPALVQLGIPSVVAMSQPISDSAASTFSQAFYRALVTGEPVEASLAEGRLAVYLANRESLEWSTPVLFTRGANDTLLEESRPAAKAETASRTDTVRVKVGTAELSDSEFVATLGEAGNGSRSSAMEFEADTLKGNGLSFIAHKT